MHNDLPESPAGPSAAEPFAGPGWRAHLQLDYERRDAGTVLARRHHSGPLVVQKALYPEGPGICHTVIVHPPGGIAGGDDLRLDIGLGAGTHAVFATPGATKWYKAPHAGARQTIQLTLGAQARLDWLPLENIVFDAARAEQRIDVTLDTGATAIGWDAILLGRQASGERWTSGQWRSLMRLHDARGELQWVEQTVLDAADTLRMAPAGLDGFAVFATLWAVGPACTAELAETMAPALPYGPELRAGATCLPGNLLLLRVLGRSMEPVRQLLIEQWLRLRPLVHGTPGVPLRLWAT
ncbi:urease accessory protein UreD [Pandoraea sp.]|uniref:urease accessory protein UreD n=1 Tax=Pandoraea sp. TaxID=1883445 RepID=UPI00120A5105|nr:urease accessory protein UreD [Pandoraea sp.]TAL57319.1 MAG: urease accessory protein [Pandoraea sp.]TAM16432.1 MAG: urease accessory protein [Pandoraea sp.]